MSGGLITRIEVCELLEIDEPFLTALEREGIVVTGADGHYPAEALDRIRVCHTLHAELEVNLPGVHVALGLLDRLERRRRQMDELVAWVRQRTGASD